MDKKLVYLLLICFSLSFMGLSVHHHKDGASHDTCLFCYHFSHDSLLIFLNNPQVSITVFETIFHLLLENTLSSVPRCYTPYLNRAPPS
jgi:hypothetical protein